MPSRVVSAVELSPVTLGEPLGRVELRWPSSQEDSSHEGHLTKSNQVMRAVGMIPVKLSGLLGQGKLS